MKRFLFTILLMGLFVILLEPAKNLLSKFLRLEQPTTHEIQSGEWLSKIAQKYYGDASYWRELALINRAPNRDLIFPGEEIIVPSFESIKKIRESRSLTSVNKEVGEQNFILAGNLPAQKAPIVSNESEESNSEVTVLSESKSSEEQASIIYQGEQAIDQTSDFAFVNKALMAGVLLLVLTLIAGIYFFIHKKKQEELAYYGATDENEETPEMKKNIFLDDFAAEHHEDNSNSKSKEVEVV